MIIGTGVDITEVSRLRRAVEKWGDSFLKRCFTAKEIKAAKHRASFFEHLAGRFAAKEAIFKALGDKDLGWQDVQVFNDKDGRPFCQMLKKIDSGIDIYISISHVKTYAVASAIITQKSPGT